MRASLIETARTGPQSLVVDGVTVRFGGVVALSDISLQLEWNSRTGLIGPNGAGKTTLLNVLSGFVRPATGQVTLGDEAIGHLPTRLRVHRGVLRSFQTVRLLEQESLFVNVLLGRQRFRHATGLGQLVSSPFHRRAERRDREAARRVIATLGLSRFMDRPVGELPFGVRRLVEVGRVLAAEPAAMLLDEPAAGLDAASRLELAHVLVESHSHHPTTLVVVEHDVELVRNLCEHAFVLDAGRLIASGTPQHVLQLDVVREAYFGRASAEG